MKGLALSPEVAPVGTPIPGRLAPAKVGIILFIIAEVMFFSGMISSFVVFRFSPTSWPPPGQPRLPIEVTSVNTFILLLSGLTFYLTLGALKSSKDALFKRLLTLTAVLGTTFLAVQGFEWLQLIKFGLTLHESIFGGFFYCLVGFHALHVTGGLGALLWVLAKAWRGGYSAQNSLGVEVCRMYWFFVVGLWPILFVLVYL